MAELNKVVLIGRVKNYNDRRMKIYAKITIKDGKLSISGVEGPMRNGNCCGGAGQIDMSYKTAEERAKIEPGAGWNRALIARFFDVWNKWHLNDMRAGCEHQRAAGWGKKELILLHYELNDEITKKRREIKEKVEAAIKKERKAEITPEEQELLNLPHELTLPGGPEYPVSEAISARYHQIKSSYRSGEEKKNAGWVYEKDHPDGVLCKPCPVCGYKYGSSWLREELPQDVIDFLKSLPDCPEDDLPAWV